jgi:phosphatidylglycerol lysyltransferase
MHSVKPAEVMAQIRSAPAHTLALAVLATAIGYGALIGYDALALHFIGKRLPRRAAILGGFLGYAFGNTIGISVISGGAVRYRIYSAYGLDALEVATVSGYVAAALGTGLTLVGLAALGISPEVAGHTLHLPLNVIRVGAFVLVALAIGVITYLSVKDRRVSIRGLDLHLPSPQSLLAQLGITLVDIIATAFALWVLMPDGTPDFGPFIAIYAIATMIGILTHVPGGIGVFETVVITALPSSVAVTDAAAALVLFRIIYYLLPFALGFVIVSLNEARLAGGKLGRLIGRLPNTNRPAFDAIHGAAPSLAAFLTFCLGVYLLMVSLIPSVRSGAIEEGDFVSVLLLEGGTLLSSIIGAVLLILARGLARRIKDAFALTLAALGLGAFAAIMNGVDLETAAVLIAGAVVLLPFAKGFPRQAKLTEGVFGAGWFALIVSVVIAGAAFFFFLHSATPYSDDLWTEIAHGANTPRALRAGLLASMLLLVFGLFVALRPVPRSPVSVKDEDALQRITEILAQSGTPHGCLALSGDKHFAFSDSGQSFLMYGVQGRRWIAYGDPIGIDKEFPDLFWRFIDLARRMNGQPMFYEVGTQTLSSFVEMGFALHKIGEEAVVRLNDFSLAGSNFKSMRAAHNKRQREGLAMEIVAPPHSASLIADLRCISNLWLEGKAGREKGFSVGKFEAEYLNHFSIALVRSKGRILAFANILTPGDGGRVAIDVMRYLPEEASGIMEFLFISLIEHYRDAGAMEFSLGIAPLSGLSSRSMERIWRRFGRFIYRHGGTFYNFEGLRAFKQKFRPDWQPRYIALPPNASPMRAMADVALLIAGGARGLIGK